MMTAKNRKLLHVLCLCALLLCGRAMAELDTVNTADFSSVLPYRGAFTRSAAGSSAYNENGIGTDSGSTPSEQADVQPKGHQPAVPYLSYDADGKALGSANCTSYTMIVGVNSDDNSWRHEISGDYLAYYDLDGSNGGSYVVQGTAIMGIDTTIRVTGDVHLILCDEATLNARDGIYIREGSSLSIYGQSQGTGKLIAKPGSGPGIGGMNNTMAGSLYIHGGVIDAEDGTNAAGIGSGQQNPNVNRGTVSIYGGTVEATGGKYAAGIGGGEDCSSGSIHIYGGDVTAKGGSGSDGTHGAGIGGGAERNGGGNSGTIFIKGGVITATSELWGDGTGCEKHGGTFTDGITIIGGEVKAASSLTVFDDGLTDTGAGIGSGGRIIICGGKVTAQALGKSGICSPTIRITGGTVFAFSATGAGIGGHSGGSIEISGGNIYAASSDKGAGIGGGNDCSGPEVTISGGNLVAVGGHLDYNYVKEHGFFTNQLNIQYISGYEMSGLASEVSNLLGTGLMYLLTRGEYAGAGIGGGDDANGGKVSITGGNVTCIAGKSTAAPPLAGATAGITTGP